MGIWLLVAIAFAACSYLVYSIGIASGRRRRIRANLARASAPSNPSIDPALLPEETHMAIREALARNRRIEAVGLLREASGLSLKEAKQAIEAMEGR